MPGHQLVVMEQKEKAETVLLESEKEAACQDHAPNPPPKKKKEKKITTLAPLDTWEPLKELH